ncbi:ATP-binding protein [Pseudoruegeria sp. SK021]|uniref:ATP-binding protein n=1 Tax=Pseudoruegeria sp. SK021 TaxID=1933035 RepID=UPI000A21E7E5|nr:ATP-binding protein [Pseudoruegeria sp. SK021]OSP54461.1 AAA family ATPase [Pseudoruegeria sp. SK021]
MTKYPTDIPQRVIALRSIFVDQPAWLQLEEQFHRLLENRRAEIATNVVRETRGIALIGASGSGKSTAIARLLRTSPKLVLANTESHRCDVISLTVPSPATLKSLGRAIAEALGRPLKHEKTADTTWELVRAFLKERRVLFLHLDEAQDISRHQTPKEMQAIVNTLKSLMQHKEWPVGLLLSGMPGLRDLLNHDPQLSRRVYPVELPRLSPVGDTEAVKEMIRFYADEANLDCAENRDYSDLAARLIHAADREFGLAIEMTIDSVEEALRAGCTQIDNGHFTAAFARRSGCIPGLNPFIAEDFERINVRKLLDRGEEE